jgi:hypothetical protein
MTAITNLDGRSGGGGSSAKHYGFFDVQPTAQKVADSVSVVNGTITSGDVTSTLSINGVYLEVQETGKFEITFTFAGVNTVPARCKFAGRYEGNPAHAVFIEIYNFNTMTWDRVTAASNDFPSSATDYVLYFDLPRSTDYVNGSDEVQLRIRHDSTSIAGHFMYTDFIAMVESSLEFSATPGTPAQITNLTEGPSSGITINGVAGTMTIDRDGDYEITFFGCGTGTAESGFTCHLFLNGAQEAELWRRRIGAAGDVGSVPGGYSLTLVNGDVLSWWLVSDTASSYATIFDAHVAVKEM